jgi:hypothetical protein
MRSLSRRCVNRVIAPEGEILSFAPPLESIQRKGGSIAAQPAVLSAANENKIRYCVTSVTDIKNQYVRVALSGQSRLKALENRI